MQWIAMNVGSDKNQAKESLQSQLDRERRAERNKKQIKAPVLIRQPSRAQTQRDAARLTYFLNGTIKN